MAWFTAAGKMRAGCFIFEGSLAGKDGKNVGPSPRSIQFTAQANDQESWEIEGELDQDLNLDAALRAKGLAVRRYLGHGKGSAAVQGRLTTAAGLRGAVFRTAFSRP